MSDEPHVLLVEQAAAPIARIGPNCGVVYEAGEKRPPWFRSSNSSFSSRLTARARLWFTRTAGA
jgi:hypothetical protein